MVSVLAQKRTNTVVELWLLPMWNSKALDKVLSMFKSPCAQISLIVSVAQMETHAKSVDMDIKLPTAVPAPTPLTSPVPS